MSKSYFVLSESLEQLIKDFRHFYGNFENQKSAEDYLTRLESASVDPRVKEIKIVKITFEELS